MWNIKPISPGALSRSGSMFCSSVVSNAMCCIGNPRAGGSSSGRCSETPLGNVLQPARTTLRVFGYFPRARQAVAQTPAGRASQPVPHRGRRRPHRAPQDSLGNLLGLLRGRPPVLGAARSARPVPFPFTARNAAGPRPGPLPETAATPAPFPLSAAPASAAQRPRRLGPAPAGAAACGRAAILDGPGWRWVVPPCPALGHRTARPCPEAAGVLTNGLRPEKGCVQGAGVVGFVPGGCGSSSTSGKMTPTLLQIYRCKNNIPHSMAPHVPSVGPSGQKFSQMYPMP